MCLAHVDSIAVVGGAEAESPSSVKVAARGVANPSFSDTPSRVNYNLLKESTTHNIWPIWTTLDSSAAWVQGCRRVAARGVSSTRGSPRSYTIHRESTAHYAWPIWRTLNSSAARIVGVICCRAIINPSFSEFVIRWAITS